MSDAWNDFTDAILIEKLKEDYINALEWNTESKIIESLKVILEYYMVYTEYEKFMKEIEDERNNS